MNSLENIKEKEEEKSVTIKSINKMVINAHISAIIRNGNIYSIYLKEIQIIGGSYSNAFLLNLYVTVNSFAQTY